MKPVVVALVCVIVAAARVASADPDPKRKVIVLEYRSGSSALPGMASRMVTLVSKLTSLQVLGTDQVRVIYGSDLDQALATCAGDASCLAQIGKKVGAVDVVLVAVSELGDVILTMQRIEVRRSEVVARIADSFATGAVPSDDQINGYLTRLLAPTDFMRYGTIEIVSNLPGAAVTVGGQPRGKTPIAPLKLPAPASYDVRLEATGYVPWVSRIALPADGEMRVVAEMSKQGTDGAWYGRWYVLVGASVLIAGAAGTAIYFGTRTEVPDRVPVGGMIE